MAMAALCLNQAAQACTLHNQLNSKPALPCMHGRTLRFGAKNPEKLHIGMNSRIFICRNSHSENTVDATPLFLHYLVEFDSSRKIPQSERSENFDLEDRTNMDSFDGHNCPVNAESLSSSVGDLSLCVESITESGSKDIRLEPREPVNKTEDLLTKFLNSGAARNISSQPKLARWTGDQIPNGCNADSFHQEQEIIEDLLSRQSNLSLTDKILQIVNALPKNHHLEDFLDQLSAQLDTKNGNEIMMVLGEQNYVLEALSCFQWMRLQEPCLLDAKSYSIIFDILQKAGMADHALALFHNLPNSRAFHSPDIYNNLLSLLLIQNRNDDIKSLMKEMHNKGIEPNSHTCTLLITSKRKTGSGLRDVWSLFKSMIEKGTRPNVTVFGSLIKAFCDQGLRKEALVIASKTKRMGMPLNIVIYNTLMDAYGKAGELAEAEGLLLEMRENGVQPNEVTYNVLLSAYGKRGQCKAMEMLFVEMQESMLKPDVITYSTLISAYGRLKMVEKAANAFLCMRKHGILPNSHAYTALIHAYSEGRWHEKAAITFEHMKREGITPTVETYSALLNAYRLSGEVAKVQEVWKEMRNNKIAGTRITMNILIDAFSKQGLYEEARNIIFEFGKLGVKPNLMTYNMLINAYARGGRHQYTTRILQEMREAGFEPDTYTYSTIIYAFFRVRDYKMAFKYHKEMCMTGKQPDEESYARMKGLLDQKLAKKVVSDRKAALGQIQKLKGGKIKSEKEKRFWKRKRRLKL